MPDALDAASAHTCKSLPDRRIRVGSGCSMCGRVAGRAGGIPVIVLKGPATGLTAYGDPSLRAFGDIDLLVSKPDLIRARDFLFATGYERDYESGSEANMIRAEHALEFSGPNAKVELHSTLLSRYLRVPFDRDMIWARLAQRDTPARKCLSPSSAQTVPTAESS